MALTGCYEEFTPDIDTRPVLCLNSLITAGEPIEVEVTHTWLYTDTIGEYNHSVSDAIVTVYANGNRVGSDYLPQQGDHIRITASSHKYGDAEAEVTVPVAVPASDVDLTLQLSPRSGIYLLSYLHVIMYFDMNIAMTINDIPSVENYFHYALNTYDDRESDHQFNYSLSLYTGSLQYESVPIFAEHIGALESVMGADAWGFTFFTDRQFSGQSYTLNLQYTNTQLGLYIPLEEIDDLRDFGFTVSLSTVSESYYYWSNYCWQTESGLTSDLSGLGVADPMYGYSNVSTGAGVVAARTVSDYRISLRDFTMEKITDYLQNYLQNPAP